MEWPTAAEWWIIGAVLLLGSLALGAIDVWWTRRKEEKERKEREKWQNK
jgi:type VI protein secretion system component VasK